MHMSEIERQFQAARQNLLDLTMRNRLLNFRPSKARTLRVMDEIPREIYDILVLNEKAVEFLPRAKTTRASVSNDESLRSSPEPEEDSTSGLTPAESSQLWELPPPGTQVEDRHVDRFLQTTLDSETLQRRLFQVYQESRSILEEVGYSILYLAMGFLEWTENENPNELRRAPLILVPVELERSKVGTSFRLRWSAEDVSTNISLQAVLSRQRITLPDFEMPEDKAGIDQYYQSVLTATSNMPKWRVLADMYLGFFSFTRFIMYKDLDPSAWPEGTSPVDHPLMHAIFAPASGDVNDDGCTESDVEQKLSAPDVYHVLDADPSQIAVIEDVKVGRNLVVEGPPGTGKSQTIANMIAELLAAGKSVLFVSEKMAALQVVKSRLDQVGLGDFCMELHSRKSNKRQVLDELRRTIESPAPGAVSELGDLDQLTRVKSELNGYAEALREAFGGLGRSPFALFCTSQTAQDHFARVGRSMPRLSFQSPKEWNQDLWNTAKSAVGNLAEALALVMPVTKHPWWGCRPGMILPSATEEIDGLIQESKENLRLIQDYADQLAIVSAIQRPLTLSDVPHAIEAARTMAESRPLGRDVLLNPGWHKSEESDGLLTRVESLQIALPAVASRFQATALSEDVAPLVQEYQELSSRFFLLRAFDRRLGDLKSRIGLLYKGPAPGKHNAIISDLEGLVTCQALRREITQQDQIGRAFFGPYWQGESSDTQALREIAKWVPRFQRLFSDGAITEDALSLVSQGLSKPALEEALEGMIQCRDRFLATRDRLAVRIGVDYQQVFGTVADEVPFSDFVSRLDVWQAELGKLQQWAQFVSLADACGQSAAGPIAGIVKEDRLLPEDLVPCFEGNFADGLLGCAFPERPALANFIGALHEKKIEDFARLDRELIKRNRQRLACKLYEARPRIAGGASPGSEAGILMGQFSRRRGHMPIRKLMSLCGGLIRRIKPCFMMSPLSVAQFLDPKTVRFDVIIFDEASQVRPEDALGALLRGNQAVVVGDTHQLPPTTFFDHIVQGTEEDDDGTETLVSDVDSILDICRHTFPSKTLRWHYRSRHESLIAVSNQEFYDNRLLIYPSCIDRSEDLGLMFVHLPDTEYDRGRSQVNRREARTVAEAALEHYSKYPGKSLGVGAFNIKQQEAILQEVELQLRAHPEMEEFFARSRPEHFFVKNLETIQGDERDVIFISVGFGFDADRRFTQQLGPLNQEGGERRLNVLITRAKERCVVFSNFRGVDLSLDPGASVGIRVLKVFLEYAESRRLPGAESAGFCAGSVFEDGVGEWLRSHGYDVRQQVGAAGFRVDLAIVDPQSPGRYIMGLESDGPKYHSCRVARERDRLREQVLRDRGWRINRVWSTDWYRSRSDSEASLLRIIEQELKRQESVPDAGIADPSLSVTVPLPADAIAKPSRGSSKSSVSSSNDNRDWSIPAYQVCESLGIPQEGELLEQPARLLAQAVFNVVQVEGPVHFDEVVRRVRSLWGVKRSSGTIHDAISTAISLAEQTGKIRWASDFLWPVEDRPIPVRCRCGGPPPRIDLICDEEIAEALRLILRRQFATLPDDLAVRCIRLLGIQVSHANTLERVYRVIQRLVSDGILQEMPNGMIDLAQR